MASTETLNNIEKERLKDLNDRTACFSVRDDEQLPSTRPITALGFKFQSIQIQRRSRDSRYPACIFIIFGDLGNAKL